MFFAIFYIHDSKCYAMLCYVMLCYVMLCYVMLCYVYVCLCYVMLCYVMLCYVKKHRSAMAKCRCGVAPMKLETGRQDKAR